MAHEPSGALCLILHEGKGWGSGAQLGIFEGRGPIHEKGTVKLFLKKTRPSNTVLPIPKWRK